MVKTVFFLGHCKHFTKKVFGYLCIPRTKKLNHETSHE